MNEAFEKILEKLEEYEYENLVEHDSEMANHCKQDCNDVNDCTLCVWDKAIEIVKQEAEKFGTDINVVSNGWIPCSERLPEEYTVLCCDKYGEMIVGHPYFDEVSNTNYSSESDNEMMYNCIAWQPLPEPYKESED